MAVYKVVAVVEGGDEIEDTIEAKSKRYAKAEMEVRSRKPIKRFIKVRKK